MGLHCASPGSYTDYLEEQILSHILGVASFTSPSQLYAGLGESTGTFEDGTFDEVVDPGYERQPIKFIDPPTVFNADDGVVEVYNKYKLVFGPAAQDWSIVNHIAIFDAKEDGHMLTWGPLLANWHVKKDWLFTLKPKDVISSLTKGVGLGWWSNYLREKVLNHIFLNHAYSQPTIYAALSDRMPAPDDTGDTIVEPSDSAYHRPVVSSWTAPNPYYSGGAPFYGTATSSWLGADSADFPIMLDAGTHGNVLFFGHSSISRTVRAGDSVYLGLTYCGVD